MNSPIAAMRQLLEDDPRFKIEAYQFIREALQFANENPEQLPKDHAAPEPIDEGREVRTRHVTGGQLCHACRLYAMEQYGYLSRMVLSSWGIETTSDLGELVYNLIRIEQMRKSESDRREDFDSVYDFHTAFEPEFEWLPADSEETL